MPVISLLTDFGLSDSYAGIMKGVIASLCPDARVIDITHQVAPGDIYGAAYALSSACPYFPKDTIHVTVVDPGVGSGRRIIAVRTGAGIFLAPDNGVLSMVADKYRVSAAYSVENRDIFIHPVSKTFHGRDIFAPVAAYLACKMDMAELGPAVSEKSLVRLDYAQRPELDEKGRLCGSVIAVDRFGNLITNIGREDIEEAFGAGRADGQEDICINAGDRIIRGISESYSSVPEGALLAIIGSTGRLEISVNAGNAASQLKLGRKDRVTAAPCDAIND
ncbi:MAG: SAM-dependent chlorinase/fluorinase [Desulfobacterales bacterium]|nr:SAM-dependent chlorinase/fluorinase [Desulfobacterales bacterium]